MKRRINKIKLFANDNETAQGVIKELEKRLLENDFMLVSDNPDLAIAVGGDGSFLRMVKKNNFNSAILYVGVNAGTLGFLQEIKITDLDLLIECLNTNNYKIGELGIQETTIVTNQGEEKYYSLNEILIRERDLNTVILNINVDGARLEKYVGDGVLIATSIGSTAYNLSFGGSIVFNSFHTLQITPIAPLNNKVYRNLLNSLIVPENVTIEITPEPSKPGLLVSIDGDNKIYQEVRAIKTVVNNKRIKCLRLEDYNFFEKINDKFLSK